MMAGPADQYSLDNLRDIVVPDPPPLWPPAPEAWLLLAVVVIGIAILLVQWRWHRQANAYRHVGLSLLQDTVTVQDVSIILKRVALAAFPREQVASLYGDEWAAFLGKTGGRRDFWPLVAVTPDSPASEEVRELAAAWIRHHRASRGESGA